MMSGFEAFIPYVAAAFGGMAVSKMMAPDAPAVAAPAPSPVANLAPVEAPKPTEPTIMPTPNDPNSAAVKRASIAEQIKRRGRSSTILTNQDDTLGGA